MSYLAQSRARGRLHAAIRRGEITPGLCAHRDQAEVRGGCRGRIEAHHEDYSRPLDVVWLCLYHHRHLHGARAWGNYSPEEAQV